MCLNIQLNINFSDRLLDFIFILLAILMKKPHKNCFKHNTCSSVTSIVYMPYCILRNPSQIFFRLHTVVNYVSLMVCFSKTLSSIFMKVYEIVYFDPWVFSKILILVIELQGFACKMGNFLGFQTLTQKMLLLVFWKFCRIIDYVLLADSFTVLSCTQGIMFIMFLKKTFFTYRPMYLI